MDLGQQKEQFSLAYVHAVASVAGFATYQPSVDEDSIDLGIAARELTTAKRSPRVELQLKCTEKPDWHGVSLHYPLKRKNFVDLRGIDVLVPRLLVVVTVPDHLKDWIVQSDQELSLRRCAYWLSLRHAPDRPTTTSVTVEIPKTQQFTVASLTTIMQAIGRGTPP